MPHFQDEPLVTIVFCRRYNTTGAKLTIFDAKHCTQSEVLEFWAVFLTYAYFNFTDAFSTILTVFTVSLHWLML